MKAEVDTETVKEEASNSEAEFIENQNSWTDESIEEKEGGTDEDFWFPACFGFIEKFKNPDTKEPSLISKMLKFSLVGLVIALILGLSKNPSTILMIALILGLLSHFFSSFRIFVSLRILSLLLEVEKEEKRMNIEMKIL